MGKKICVVRKRNNKQFHYAYITEQRQPIRIPETKKADIYNKNYLPTMHHHTIHPSIHSFIHNQLVGRQSMAGHIRFIRQTRYPVHSKQTNLKKKEYKQIRRIHQDSQTYLFHISRSQGLDDTRSFAESRPEDPVGVLEHAVLQGDDDELRSLEARLDQTADVLRV